MSFLVRDYPIKRMASDKNHLKKANELTAVSAGKLKK